MENIFVEFLPPWVETGLQPAFYDKESGTVLQQTARMYARVNMLIRMFNKLSKNTKTTVENYIEQFNHLHDYVHDYFDNLDVQEEINNKLDQMVEDGVLQEIIAQYLDTTAMWTFDTVADMQSATNLNNGSFAQTLGYYAKGDGGGATYKIRTKTGADTPNGRDIISISDTIVAEIVFDNNTICVRQFGAKGNGTDDDTTAIQQSIAYAMDNNLTDIYLHNGTYLITSPIMLYNFLNLKGENRENTKIVKSGHNLDSVYSQDCVLTATYRAGDSLHYPRYIAIDNILLESADNSDQPAFGLYLNTSCFITLTHFASRHTGCCIYTGDMWLSTLKEISTGYGTRGLQTKAGTTLSIDDIYTNNNTEYGYYFQGLSYTSMRNVACDSCPGGETYYFYTCDITIDGLGCEANDHLVGIHAWNSQIKINSAKLNTNESNSSAVLLKIQNADVNIVNPVIGSERAGGIYNTEGKFLQFDSTGSHLTLNGTRVFTNFLTPNVNTYEDNTITQIDSNIIANTIGELRSFVGTRLPYDRTTPGNRLNLPTSYSQLSEPCNHETNYNYNRQSIAYRNDDRPTGAIIPNSAPLRSGTIMFVKTSESDNCEIINPITATSVADSKITLTFSNIELNTVPEYKMDKITNKWRARKKGTTTAYTVDSVDYANHTLTVNSTTGFAVGDYVELLPPRDVRDCTFLPVQGVLYGATTDRPPYPKNGTMFWDTTLDKPIWRVGNNWKDATGTNV